MNIPADNLNDFILELIDTCFKSQNKRQGDYERYRNYFLFGDKNGKQSPLNRLKPHIELKSSFLYSSGTASFSVIVGEEKDKLLHLQAQKFNRIISADWKDGNFDLINQMAVEWALINGLSFIKLIPEGRTAVPYFCHPSSMGVYREDIPYTDRQEVVIQKYLIPKAELYRQLMKAGKDPTELMKKLVTTRRQDNPVMQKQIEAASSPAINMPGDSGGAGGRADFLSFSTNEYNASANDNLVEMNEIWVWDDEIDDYRTITSTNDHIIFNRPNIFIPKELPFVAISPNPLIDYFWGISEIAIQIPLQEGINQRMKQIKHANELADNPPIFSQGTLDDTGEDFEAWKPGARFSSNDPNAKIQPMFLNTIPNTIQEIEAYSQFMNDLGGITDIMQGKGSAGVRAEGHASLLSRISSSRPKNKALIIEDSVNKIATLLAKVIRRNDKAHYEIYVNNQSEKFVISEFTPDFTVCVNNHSTSPLFAYDVEQQMTQLLQLGIIDNKLFVETVNPPNKEAILAYLENKSAPTQGDIQKTIKILDNVKKIEKAEAELTATGKGR